MTQKIAIAAFRPSHESLNQVFKRFPQLRGLVIPALILVIWESAAQLGLVAPNLLPAPSVVLSTIWELTYRGEIWQHIGITLYRVFLGFLLGAVTATVLGGLTGYSKVIYTFLDPLIQSLRNIPSLAWVPLFILWLGIQETSKITLVAVGVFFPIYLSLMSGIRDVDRKLIEVGKVYRLKNWQLITRVFLPATLPAYVVGIRSGLGLGWMFVVAAELMGASQGLGFLLVDGQSTGRPAITIASIFLFAIFGKLTDSLVVLLSSHFLSWQDSYIAKA
ncbi:ABC transporter permease [Synechococcus elongatus]|uniref:ABC transporter permease n=1 Tax=Synechococcus elongatus TaxID=32046 RepID=UPI000F7EE7FB|nr:ABC transporter permease [Synechococcus elongatus]